MENLKSRAFLRQQFAAGQIPTANSFDALISSQINEIDDLVQRRVDGNAGDSLCIGAGNKNSLLSFFSTISNTAGEWRMELGPSGPKLNFIASQNTTPVLSLDPSGKVGVGTITPQASLDVNGEIRSNSLKVCDKLEVAGTATVSALNIPSLGTITNADSLRKILNGGDTSSSNNNSQHDNGGSDANNNGTHVSSGNTSDSVTKQIAASRNWQKVAGPFEGFQALDILAWVDGKYHRSICRGSAVCIDADPSRNAISLAQSYQGRPGAKIRFRWEGTKDSYFLECRVAIQFPADTQIHLKIDHLM